MTAPAHFEPTNRKVRLQALTISNFRGFNRPVRLNFDASAVLFHGPNGSGKTSVFDALQWLLTDDLPRLGEYRLRKADLYLTNAFADGNFASVEALFDSPTGSIRATRRGDGRGSVLELEHPHGRLEGLEAKEELKRILAPGSLPLEEILHTSGLLQQDDLRQLLQTKPDERYRQLMRLLGLEALDQFERIVQLRRTDARDSAKRITNELDSLRKQRDALAEQLETAQAQVQRVSETTDLKTIAETICKQNPGTLSPSMAAHADWSSELLSAETARIRAVDARLQRELDRLPKTINDAIHGELVVVEGAVETAELSISDSVRSVEQAEGIRSRLLASSNELGRLSAAALPFLPSNGESVPCPVCETVIEPQAVRLSLELRAANSEALAAAEANLSLARSNRDTASSNLRTLQSRLAELRSRNEDQVRSIAMATALAGEVDALYTASLLRPTTSRTTTVGSLATADGYATAVADLESFRALLSRLRTVCEAIDTAAAEVAQRQAANRVAAERANSIPRIEEGLALAKARVDEATKASEHARRASNSALGLHEATKSANEDIFRRRFSALEPLMNDVYARLDPHPAFTNLSFTVESFRSRGTATATVTDAERNISVNPMLVFSSAQANIVVLSAFLALGWAAGPSGLPFVLLDDPLQAMDDVNVLGFADLARHLRRERQLVLATHESRFAGLLERKLSGRYPGEDLIVHEFVGWSRSGPEIETRVVPIAEDQGRTILIA